MIAINIPQIKKIRLQLLLSIDDRLLLTLMVVEKLLKILIFLQGPDLTRFLQVLFKAEFKQLQFPNLTLLTCRLNFPRFPAECRYC